MMKFRIGSKKNQADRRVKNSGTDESAMLRHLLEIGKLLLTESDVNRLLAVAMDQVVEISGAERGMIILFDDEGEILFETARNLRKEDIDHPEFEISRTIINKVKTQRKQICLRNALEDPDLQSKSATRLKILSVICLPMMHNQEVFGVIYLENRTVKGVFKRETFTFVEMFADFVSLAAHHALTRKMLNNHVQALEKELRRKYQFGNIVSHHPKMVEILKIIAQIADADTTVMIQGESGTGKELVARALHFNSNRSKMPFLPINCGALPENILESELFGHVRGAFTGAIKDKMGWFESADGGTIFLDEISEMSPALQVKLLRVLQTGEYSKVGDTSIRSSDVRIVTATNKDLTQLIKTEKFREDLYYRLKVIEIEIPPLRDRKSDIPLLIQHFLKLFGDKSNKKNLQLSQETESMLMDYDYPGNVRELENIIQRAVVLTEDKLIVPKLLPENVFKISQAPSESKSDLSFKEAKQQIMETFEKDYIIANLSKARGNISTAAQMSKMTYKNYYDKMIKYGIEPSMFKPEK